MRNYDCTQVLKMKTEGKENETFKQYKDLDLGFERWNGCAGRTTNRRMCNQDTPWRSSEEEDVDKMWSGDDEDSSHGTAGESTISCCCCSPPLLVAQV